jgi:membrane-bound lytic murein transglycosylase A
MARFALMLVLVGAGCRGSGAPAASAAPPRTDKTPKQVAECSLPDPVVVPCEEEEPEATVSNGDEKLRLATAKFSDLPGWSGDEVERAVPAFLRSCEKLAKLDDAERVGAGPYGGTAKDWRAACGAAKKLPAKDAKAARAFWQKYFKPYAAHGAKGPVGKATGYYVQPLRGSLKKGGKYIFPLYARPPDLVVAHLSDFVSDGRDRRIWGRVDPVSKKFIPYPRREEMRKDPIARSKPIIWVDDPFDALAVEVEGSGKATLPDGSTVWVGFAAKNGRRSRRLGGTLRAVRQLRRWRKTAAGKKMSVKEYLDKFEKTSELMDSVVFFELQKRAGAIGTQEVILTPRRSLAVDRAVIPLSTPVFMSTRAPSAPGGRVGPWNQLMIAQDTGGAIKGSVRGDIYWGSDAAAVSVGNRTYGKARMWLLLPSTLQVKTMAKTKTASAGK